MCNEILMMKIMILNENINNEIICVMKIIIIILMK